MNLASNIEKKGRRKKRDWFIETDKLSSKLVYFVEAGDSSGVALQGDRGSSGVRGLRGDSGNQGPSGRQGPAGKRGAVGSGGPPGKIGEIGPPRT